MSLESVNTNMGAMVALQSLESTQTQLSATQKQISTGYRVADSSDDGAAYAIAQGIRATVGAVTASNEQLGNVQGLLSTAQTGLNGISTTMASMRDVLVKLSDTSETPADQANYQQQYASLLANVKTFITDSNYNGKSLIGNVAGTSVGGNTAGFSSVTVARDGNGDVYNIAAQGASAIYHSLAALTGASITPSAYQSALGTGGNFINQQTAIGKALNTIGSNINYVNNQVTFNNDKIDALNSGLGSLVDADLAKESAQLTALQIRQQLGTQALSLANQAPQTLLSLFK